MRYILPGMGADQGMYCGPWRSLKDSEFVDWPEGARVGTVAELAARVVADVGIQDGAVLVGSSLGGIVACEIAKIRAIRTLYLIGSARRREEVNGRSNASRQRVTNAWAIPRPR